MKERGRRRAAPGISVITLMHRHDDAFSTAESLARFEPLPSPLLSLFLSLSFLLS